jgi:5-methylcytosine-specific restriction endonuclease McrA
MASEALPQIRPIITRSQARALGLKRYFTGRPCKRGHLVERLVSTSHCDDCMRLYEVQNREKYRERFRRWRENNPEKNRKKSSRWLKKHPERSRVKNHLRRARERNAVGSFTTADIAEILKLQRNCCARCRTSLKNKTPHIDHIKPLELGGSNDRRNLQLLCSTCNASKGARDPIDDMRRLGRLL